MREKNRHRLPLPLPLSSLNLNSEIEQVVLVLLLPLVLVLENSRYLAVTLKERKSARIFRPCFDAESQQIEHEHDDEHDFQRNADFGCFIETPNKDSAARALLSKTDSSKLENGKALVCSVDAATQ
jgi:hypothetical protein